MSGINLAPRFSRRAAPPAPTPPPSGREALHGWLRQRLHADLVDPVSVREFRNRHVVTVMRGIEVLVRRRGRRIDVRGRRGPGGDDWLVGTLRLDRPLHGLTWAAAWWWAVRPGLPSPLQREAARAGTTALVEWIDRAARCSGLLSAARRKVIVALRLDHGLLRRARAMCSGADFNTDDYVFTWRNARAFRLCECESPRLLPLHGLMRKKRWMKVVEIGRLRGFMRHAGLTMGGWKMLCRHGRNLWWPMRHCHEYKLDPLRETIVMANQMAASGRHGLPPPPLVLAIARMRSMSPNDGKHGTRGLLPLFCVAWRCMDALPDASARAAFARGRLESLLTDWSRLGCSTSPPRGAGLAWFERECAHAQLRLRDADAAWCRAGLAADVVDGIEIMPLTRLAAVRAAGLLLRNCMTQANAGEAGRSTRALCLMSDAEGRALAMFSVSRAGNGASPVLGDIRGRFNQPVAPPLRAVALMYLQRSRFGAGRGDAT